jgi:hypothetical protein
VANAFLNNTNQQTPLGSLSYDQTGNFSWTDPTSGSVYNIPRFTATQTLGPTQQQAQDQQEAAKLNLATLGNVQSGRLGQQLAGTVDLSNASAPGAAGALSNMPGANGGLSGEAVPLSYDINPYTAQQTGFGNAGQPAGQFGGTPGSIYGFGGTGDVTRSYGPADNFSADRQRVEQSLFDRLNPQLDRQRAQIEQHLADQGIRYGSPAYSAAMDDFNRQSNDARLAITAQGGQEQQRMADMAAQRAGFQNAAQQQEYTQARGRGEFYNTAEQQAFGEAQARGTFANQAQQSLYEQLLNRAQFANQAGAQQFQQNLNYGNFRNATVQQAWQQAALRNAAANQAAAQNFSQAQSAVAAQNAARAQYLQEQYALRNQPINEISALLSGSQVQQPTFMQTPQQQIPTTDYAALINQNFQQQFQNYQQQNQNTNQLLGGVLGAAGSIGAGLAFRSDRRAKENIHRIGTVFAAEPQPVQEPEKKKLPVYEYSYKDDPASTRHIGPMAQDMEKIDPGAVGKDRKGMRYIDAGRMMGSILRAA